MATALVSSLTKLPVKKDVAMTEEILKSYEVVIEGNQLLSLVSQMRAFLSHKLDPDPAPPQPFHGLSSDVIW